MRFVVATPSYNLHLDLQELVISVAFSSSLHSSCYFSVATVYRFPLRQQPLKMMLGPRRQAMAHFTKEYYENGWPEGGVAIWAACRSLLLW